MAIQDDSTLVTKGDLKEYHEALLPYLGGNFMLSTNVSDYYYTDETIVGVYTDGKPVYQKSYTFGSVEAGTVDAQGNIESVIVRTLNTWKIDKIVYASGCATASNGNKIAIPYTQEAGKNSFTIGAICWEAESEKILFINCSTYALTNVTVNIRYTKSTDAAGSATATPGCYDINRPDLWPTDKEIFFGNGLYGYRVISTTDRTIPANGQYNSDPVTTNVTYMLNQGGKVKSKSGGWYFVFGATSLADSIASGWWIDPNNNNALKYYIENAKNSSQIFTDFDIWVTYTK